MACLKNDLNLKLHFILTIQLVTYLQLKWRISGFSVGDELGFKESISNTEINRRRSAQVSKMQAQLIQATQKQPEDEKTKVGGEEKVVV